MIKPIRVALADRLTLNREAVACLIDAQPDLTVVAAASSIKRLVEVATATAPDVAVVDADLPADHLKVTARLHEVNPTCAVLLLVAQRCRPSMLKELFDAHGRGIVARNVSARQFIDSIRRAFRGERVADARLAIAAVADHHGLQLTPRERTILSLVAAGSPVREVAAELHLSVGTVSNYMSSVIAKTGARNRIDAIRIAKQEGWL